jgi:Asp-tRNA(Asn)/Glu-tRNA(Gln) amidotransferase A subunit family amidase
MLDELTAVECLRRLNARELSAVELGEETLARIDAADRELNAVAALDGDAVLAAAAEADAARRAGSTAPLLGLPVTIKDTIGVAGLPFQSGSLARAGHVAEDDATVVARLREAGAIVAAKTAVPEYAWSYETESVLHGRTLNAFDPLRTSGGSSGGEGALIGCGASLAGIGTDGGGSIRVPGHYNGIVGLRPTVGLVPETGSWPTTRDTGMLDMVCIGPMARSVEDAAMLLEAIAGRDGRDPCVAAARYAGGHRSVDPAQLRVGFYVQDGVWPASTETEAAVRRAASALEEAGALVEDVAPPPLEEANDLFFRMMAADGGARARADLAPAGGRHTEQMLFVLELTKDFAVSAEGFFTLVGRWAALRSRLRLFVAGYDVVLSPVTPAPAPLHGCRPGDEPLESYLPWTNVMAYSIAGVPVAVVPAGAQQGLPIGVHIAANPFADDVALAAAAAVEASLGGYARLSAPLLARVA